LHSEEKGADGGANKARMMAGVPRRSRLKSSRSPRLFLGAQRAEKLIFVLQKTSSWQKTAFMDFATRWLSIAIVVFALSMTAQGEDSRKEKKDSSKSTSLPGKVASSGDVAALVEEGEIDMEQIREELGVNQFTAPSIEHILAELMDLRPIPIERLWKDFKGDVPQDRAIIALSAGRVIADGLLAVIAEKPSRVEPCARALLRYAKGLGVSDHVTKNSKSILEKAARESWLDVRRELVKAQAEVEAGMMALKDEEIAHLVSLGGWLRGMEIVSALVADDYTTERAQRLVQPEAIDYFIDRLQTLSPRLKKNELFKTIDRNMKEIREIAGTEDQAAPPAEQVEKLRKLAGEIVDNL
jgi:hypothetical protein